MRVICIELISLYVQVFIPSVNEHCDHYLIVIACLIKPWFVFYHYLKEAGTRGWISLVAHDCKPPD